MRPGEVPTHADRRLPEGERRIGERLAGQLNNTTDYRQSDLRRTEVRHVFAVTYVVRGTRGRDRLDLFVTCWLCGRTHRHGANLDFVSGKRTAACRLGRYEVHADPVEGQVAA